MTDPQIKMQPVDIAFKKRVGRLGTNPVWHVATTGGFHMMVLGKSGGFEILGTGPHPGVAQHLAEKRQPEIFWEDLNKADFLSLEDFEYLIPKYTEVTERLRRVQTVKV